MYANKQNLRAATLKNVQKTGQGMIDINGTTSGFAVQGPVIQHTNFISVDLFAADYNLSPEQVVHGFVRVAAGSANNLILPTAQSILDYLNSPHYAKSPDAIPPVGTDAYRATFTFTVHNSNTAPLDLIAGAGIVVSDATIAASASKQFVANVFRDRAEPQPASSIIFYGLSSISPATVASIPTTPSWSSSVYAQYRATSYDIDANPTKTLDWPTVRIENPAALLTVGNTTFPGNNGTAVYRIVAKINISADQSISAFHASFEARILKNAVLLENGYAESFTDNATGVTDMHYTIFVEAITSINDGAAEAITIEVVDNETAATTNTTLLSSSTLSIQEIPFTRV